MFLRMDRALEALGMSVVLEEAAAQEQQELPGALTGMAKPLAEAVMAEQVDQAEMVETVATVDVVVMADMAHRGR